MDDIAEIIYDAQFNQKIHFYYFPFTWQGSLLAFFCYILPLNMFEAGGIFIVAGLMIYRVFVVKKDHDVENIFFYSLVVGFIKWIEKNKGVTA